MPTLQATKYKLPEHLKNITPAIKTPFLLPHHPGYFLYLCVRVIWPDKVAIKATECSELNRIFKGNEWSNVRGKLFYHFLALFYLLEAWVLVDMFLQNLKIYIFLTKQGFPFHVSVSDSVAVMLKGKVGAYRANSSLGFNIDTMYMEYRTMYTIYWLV